MEPLETLYREDIDERDERIDDLTKKLNIAYGVIQKIELERSYDEHYYDTFYNDEIDCLQEYIEYFEKGYNETKRAYDELRDAFDRYEAEMSDNVTPIEDKFTKGEIVTNRASVVHDSTVYEQGNRW